MSSDTENEILRQLKEFRIEQNKRHDEHTGNFNEVKTVLIGDFERKGLIGKVDDNATAVREIRDVEKNRKTNNAAVATGIVGGAIAEPPVPNFAIVAEEQTSGTDGGTRP